MGKLVPLPIPERNWEEITMDLIVKLPPSKDEAKIRPYDSILDARSFMLEGEQMAVKYDVPVANKIKDRMKVIANHLQHHLTQAQEWYKKNADRHRTTEVEFKVGEEVLVSTKNVRTQRPTKKLEMTWMGPYRIRRKLSNVTYEVALPKDIRIHPVFHIKLLKPYKRSEEPRLGNAKPPPIAVDPEEGYIIHECHFIQWYNSYPHIIVCKSLKNVLTQTPNSALYNMQVI
ncbi:hypothetical protein SeLEV6574_g08572 [Synchytrium endobioticum]|uniref:Tf2-1-like SH3-like domain-containing protein n=1 Tax=Synchytrium endobioticum TaxID=286115 RepID=A0A507BKG2_9FUNG|nr:hypothetical protein SeLEV6574_g08572 [Synchytrium endobioticum]